MIDWICLMCTNDDTMLKITVSSAISSIDSQCK